jgi:hypothetical protein
MRDLDVKTFVIPRFDPDRDSCSARSCSPAGCWWWE